MDSMAQISPAQKTSCYFFLTELGVAYLLKTDLLVISELTAQDTDKIRAACKKCEDNEVRCRGYTVNLLSDLFM